MSRSRNLNGPRKLLYARDETPPIRVLVLSGLQHTAVIIGVGIVLPLLVLGRGGLDAETTRQMLSLALVALALSSILQIQGGRFIGSGFLAPATFTAAYLPSCIAAIEKGGPGLVMGMLIFAGLVQMAMAPVLRRLRPYLPPEIGGLAVLLIGITLGLLGFRLIAESHAKAPDPTTANGLVVVGLLTIAVIIGVSVWVKNDLRLYGTLIGVIAGCVGAVAIGAIPPDAFIRGIVEQGFALPTPLLVLPSFDPVLAPQFAISAIACGLRAMGDLITCQKVEDPRWHRPDLRTIRNGILTDGLGTSIAGLIGSPIGLNTFSGSIGLAAATGVTSRRIGYALAGWLLLMALMPGLLSFFIAIPGSILGGVLIFAAAFIMFNGIMVIVGRLLDARRTLTIGIALTLGLSRDVFPEVFRSMPSGMEALTGSQLMVGVGTALVLNLIFRLGVSLSASLTLPASALEPHVLEDWVREQGGHWGARTDVIRTVGRSLVEFAEARNDLMAPDADVQIDLAFDEYHVDLTVTYAGYPLALDSAKPVTHDELDDLNPDELERRMRALLIRHTSDRVSTRQERDGRQVVTMRFEH